MYREYKQSTVILYLVALGILFRVIWIALVETTPVSDCSVYLARAISIANGLGYSLPDHSPTAYWPVGYPAFLALSLKIGDGNLYFAKGVNIAIYVLTSVGLVELAKSMRLGSGGVLALAYLSLSPNQIAYANLFASEPLGLLTVVGTVFCLIKLSEMSNMRCWFGLACMFFVFGYYVRPQILLLPFVVIVVIYVVFRNVAMLRMGLMVYIVLALAVVPWALRNHSVLGTWVPISTNGGINFYIGNNLHANGTYIWTEEVTAPLEGLNEVAAEARARELALQHIANNPWSIVRLLPAKQWHLWKTDAEGVAWNLEGITHPSKLQSICLIGFKIAAQLIYMICISLSLAGILVCWRRAASTRRRLFDLLPIAVVVYYVAIYSVFFGMSRFHYVFLPLLFVYGDVYIRRNTTASANVLEDGRGGVHTRHVRPWGGWL